MFGRATITLGIGPHLVLSFLDVGAGFCMYDVVVNKCTFVISSPNEFL